MEPMSNNLIWSSKLDGVYLCKVERIEGPKAKLTIHSQTGSLIAMQDVELTYDEKSGPTLQDVGQWQDICIRFIDSQMDE